MLTIASTSVAESVGLMEEDLIVAVAVVFLVSLQHS